MDRSIDHGAQVRARHNTQGHPRPVLPYIDADSLNTLSQRHQPLLRQATPQGDLEPTNKPNRLLNRRIDRRLGQLKLFQFLVPEFEPLTALAQIREPLVDELSVHGGEIVEQVPDDAVQLKLLRLDPLVCG